MPERAPIVIGVVGSRRRNSNEDFSACENLVLKLFKEGDTLVSGGCPVGGDYFAEIIAKKYGMSITIHYPNWNLGKHAGLLRNTKIAEDCDILIALVADDRTGGAEDTIRKARALNKPVIEG